MAQPALIDLAPKQGLERFVPPALGFFFALSTAIVAAVSMTLLVPGTPLDAIWRIKPAEYAQLLAARAWTGPGVLALVGIFAAASYLAFKRARWGWRMALAIFAVHGASDLAQALAGRYLEGAIGAGVSAAIIYGLTRPKVAALFKAPALNPPPQ